MLIINGKETTLELMQDKKTNSIILVNKEGTGIDLTGKYVGCVTADVKDSEMNLVPYAGELTLRSIY